MVEFLTLSLQKFFEDPPPFEFRRNRDGEMAQKVRVLTHCSYRAS